MSKAKYEEYPAPDIGVFTQSLVVLQLDVLSRHAPPMPIPPIRMVLQLERVFV